MGEQEAAGEVGPQLRRRRRSLLAALERVGRAEEEEEKEEEFQLPRQQEDSGFSVNKCIVAALILLGLGTIFFSGKSSSTFSPRVHASTPGSAEVFSTCRSLHGAG